MGNRSHSYAISGRDRLDCALKVACATCLAPAGEHCRDGRSRRMSSRAHAARDYSPEAHRIKAEVEVRFGDRVVELGPCPACGAAAGMRCTRPVRHVETGERLRMPLDAPHDSRVRVFENGPCGPCPTVGAFEWCIRHRWHKGQHSYDYSPEARKRAAFEGRKLKGISLDRIKADAVRGGAR